MEIQNRKILENLTRVEAIEFCMTLGIPKEKLLKISDDALCLTYDICKRQKLKEASE